MAVGETEYKRLQEMNDNVIVHLIDLQSNDDVDINHADLAKYLKVARVMQRDLSRPVEDLSQDELDLITRTIMNISEECDNWGHPLY